MKTNVVCMILCFIRNKKNCFLDLIKIQAKATANKVSGWIAP